jgi:hypothetical protein
MIVIFDKIYNIMIILVLDDPRPPTNDILLLYNINLSFYYILIYRKAFSKIQTLSGALSFV